MTTKGLKRLSTTLLYIILTIGMTISVFADLSVWYDDECYSVGTWSGTQIKYGHKKLNNNSYFYFYASGLHAIKQWEDALDISIENVILMSEANIQVYGGTRDELTVLGFDLSEISPTAPGYTYYTKTSDRRTETIDGKKVTVKKVEGAIMLIIDKGLMSNYNRVTTHELGHALGWDGHSYEKNDIMYPYSNGTQELTHRDTEQLRQVY